MRILALTCVVLAAGCPRDNQPAKDIKAPPVATVTADTADEGADVNEQRSDNPSGSDDSPSAAEAHLRALNDPDEHVRSQAAEALHEMGHPNALDACLATLDDGADPLHLDWTPSVRCLIAIGDPALAPLIERLGSPERMTRLHAQRAVEGITKRSFGFDGTKWAPGALERWLAWWEQIGYAYDGEPGQREQAIARIVAWHQAPDRD